MMSVRLSFALFAAALAAVALVPSEPAAGQGPAPKPSEALVKLTVQATPAPVPALKFVLLPELMEMQPGNSQYGYLRAFYPEQSYLHSQEAQNKREMWLGMPLKDLPRKDVAQYVRNSMMRGVYYAARLDKCDWEILHRLRTEGIGLL